MTFTALDGPQHTAADAYQHAADLAAAIAEKATHALGDGIPRWVRAEYVDHLAAELAECAERARRDGAA